MDGPFPARTPGVPAMNRDTPPADPRACQRAAGRAAHQLADRAEREAAHLLELATSAAVQGQALPWGVEQAARSLADWARRQRARS